VANVVVIFGDVGLALWPPAAINMRVPGWPTVTAPPDPLQAMEFAL
jgi:hypothetical protein